MSCHPSKWEWGGEPAPRRRSFKQQLMRTYIAFSTCETLYGRSPVERRLEVVSSSRAAAITTASELLAIPVEKLRCIELPDW